MYKWLNSSAAASGQCWVAADTRVERDNCLVFPVSAMQTLDRRISASSDQLDTLKTRYQVAMGAPALRDVYNGYRPAVTYSAIGMSLWVVSRNGLERTLTTERTGLSGHRKHLVTGGIAGVLVQVPTFPLDTLKKRLQTSTDGATILGELATLTRDGAGGKDGGADVPVQSSLLQGTALQLQQQLRRAQPAAAERERLCATARLHQEAHEAGVFTRPFPAAAEKLWADALRRFSQIGRAHV